MSDENVGLDDPLSDIDPNEAIQDHGNLGWGNEEAEEAGADEQEEGDEEDTDLPLPTCPLCLYDEVLPECASCVPSDNSYMRRIMAIELHHTGLVPNDVVYTNIARHYNRHIHKPRTRSGMESVRWTLPMVREHFEKHVGLVPRRIIGNEIQQCQTMLQAVAERDYKSACLRQQRPGECLGKRRTASEHGVH